MAKVVDAEVDLVAVRCEGGLVEENSSVTDEQVDAWWLASEKVRAA